MSAKPPVVAVTGSSGAGTTYVRDAFINIFRREGINAGIIEGDSFHSLTREEFKQGVEEATNRGDNHLSHFGPRANDFKALQNCFKEYGEHGTTKQRHYLHNKEEADNHSLRLNMPLKVGEFTPWEDIPDNTELILYEGLHGMVVDQEQDIDVTPYVDLGIGVVPSVNLEWIQKIHRDHAERGPMVDTSNPFIARDIPSLDESKVVIRFQRPSKYNIDFPFLLDMIEHSFMSRRNTIVVPGNKMSLAMETILTPILERLLEESKPLQQ